jgi:hypothetical protein
MVHVPHLFVDPAECDHVSDLFLLELPEINHPAPVVNMVDIRQIGGDSLSTIPEADSKKIALEELEILSKEATRAAAKSKETKEVKLVEGDKTKTARIGADIDPK